ncbi:hemerythrin domain-containing protein [Planosporangium sp. 12N6]|uniref:hemerythrin domain-containing protein n=1 Tax=Planosporangium spinosum TaxID=3402278 RepID=UPI003CF10889
MSHPTSAAMDRDQAAATAVRRHHAQLAHELDQRTESLLRLVDSQFLPEAEEARHDLVAYLRRDLVPHALAEEGTLYPAAAGRPAGALLVEGMLGEHHAITALVDEVASSGSLIRAASAARALTALFATHLAKENDLILPLLVSAPEVSLADLLAGMHDLLGAAHAPHGHAADAPEPAGQGGGCGCGGCGCGGGGDRAAGSTPVQPLSVEHRVRGVRSRDAVPDHD